MGLQLDPQQAAVVACEDEHISVQAFAGAGKSTTLDAYARARPGQRMLYLAFNQSAAEQARQRFPANVTCYTPHALAWHHMRSTYGHKMRPRDLAVFEAARLLHVDHLHAALALRALQHFLSSADPAPTLQHALATRPPEDMDPEKLRQLSHRLWLAMSDPRHACPISHDGYLKAFQLSWPSIYGYDALLLDEAQDTTPAVLDILLSQSLTKVFVGDAHQSIYGWRGAINALEHLPRATRLGIDGSHRFGHHVSTMARAILRVGKGISAPLRGLGEDTMAPVRAGPGSAMVFRTNSVLFDNAARLVARGGGRVHFVGGVEKYRFDALVDVWQLMHGATTSVKDPMLRHFGSFAALEDYAASAGDRELKSRCRIAKMHRDLPSMVERLTRQAAPSPEHASVVMGTAHRFKGLEAREVRVGEDFLSLVKVHNGGLTLADAPQGMEEEVNLAYVAVTRASHVLDVPQDMLDMMLLDLMRA